MCGITGIVRKNKIVNSQLLKAMNDAIIHRGPDSEGLYINKNVGLAMRRLKIIDLEGGDQPIFNEKKDILVFFNGEIYNFLALRDELKEKGHKFSTRSDTEILVHGYEEWGIGSLLDKIEGMFVFAIYDTNANKIMLARDRFGEKPLYYHFNDDAFYFSSELRSLFVAGLQKEIEPISLYYYLAMHFVPEDKTIIRNVFRLRAGHYLTLKTNSLAIKITKYWALKERKIEDSYEESKKKVRALVERSVKNRIVADVPVGAFLSGGIDSSILVGIMKKYSSDLKTFSIGFSDANFDESEHSKKVSQVYQTDHHHFIFSGEDVLEMLPDVIKYMDEPIGDQALLPVLLISREARKHVTVVIGGEGADEVFGGYDYYEKFLEKKSITNILKSFFSKKGKFINNMLNETVSGFPLITSKNDRLSLIQEEFRGIILDETKEEHLHIEKELQKIKNDLKRAQFCDIYSWLADDLLVKYDRMAMAASLEGRAPYLDSKLVDYGFNLPNDYKWERSMSKKILREAFSDILPKEIFMRKKHGFNLPMSEWLRGPLKNILKESSDLEQNDLIDNANYKRIINNHLKGREDRGRLLYSLMVYKLWYKRLNLSNKIKHNE